MVTYWACELALLQLLVEGGEELGGGKVLRSARERRMPLTSAA